MGILGLSTIVLGAVFMLRAFQLSMFGFPTISSFQDLTWNELAVLLLVSVAVLLLGLFPDTVSQLVMPALQDIISSIQDSKQ
jgi:NADH-quinone oxidoreductase subunit M